jgi:hypothetical protein
MCAVERSQSAVVHELEIEHLAEWLGNGVPDCLEAGSLHWLHVAFGALLANRELEDEPQSLSHCPTVGEDAAYLEGLILEPHSRGRFCISIMEVMVDGQVYVVSRDGNQVACHLAILT